MSRKKRRQQKRSHKRSGIRATGYKRDIEKLVRAGVERFILKDASIYDFTRMLRSAAGGGASPHPLTKSVFLRIVRDAIRKRKRNH